MKKVTKYSLATPAATLSLLMVGCSGSDSNERLPLQIEKVPQEVIGNGDIGVIGEKSSYSVDSKSVKLPEKLSIVLDLSKVKKRSSKSYSTSYASSLGHTMSRS